MNQPNNFLTNGQIRQLHKFVDEYIILRDRNDETALNDWRERVKEVFPYETNHMLVSIREIAEARGKSA